MINSINKLRKMPIYEYKCQKCEKITELLILKLDEDPGLCSKIYNDKKCGGELERIMSTVNFNVKGYSYANGYSKPSTKRK